MCWHLLHIGNEILVSHNLFYQNSEVVLLLCQRTVFDFFQFCFFPFCFFHLALTCGRLGLPLKIYLGSSTHKYSDGDHSLSAYFSWVSYKSPRPWFSRLNLPIYYAFLRLRFPDLCPKFIPIEDLVFDLGPRIEIALCRLVGGNGIIVWLVSGRARFRSFLILGGWSLSPAWDLQSARIVGLLYHWTIYCTSLFVRHGNFYSSKTFLRKNVITIKDVYLSKKDKSEQ